MKRRKRQVTSRKRQVTSRPEEIEKTHEHEHVSATEGVSWRLRELALPVSSLDERAQGGRERFVEAFIERDGCIPERVILAANAATPERLREMAAKGPELPRLTVGRDRGAVDIRLESRDGAQVKTGGVVLENRAGKQEIPLDPVTRRFRMGDLAPGKYTVLAAAAEAGGGKMAIAVRAGDVARMSGALLAAEALDALLQIDTPEAQLRVKAYEAASATDLAHRRSPPVEYTLREGKKKETN
jgi:hypothetical protein